MKKAVFILLFLFGIGLVVSSCKKDSTVNPTNTVNISGHWLGQQNYMSVLTFKLDLNLNDVVGVVGGTGSASLKPAIGTENNINIPVVVGTFKNPDVSLQLTTIKFSGKLSADKKSIVGKATVPDAITQGTTIDIDITLVKQ